WLQNSILVENVDPSDHHDYLLWYQFRRVPSKICFKTFYMSDYDFRTSGVLVILIPVHANLPKERDLEKLMLYDGVTWQEKLGRGLFNSLL
ncbi:hypothetical protein HID58_045756, partial [Brassica napus]